MREDIWSVLALGVFTSSGVEPHLSVAVGSAPSRSSALTISVCPPPRTNGSTHCGNPTAEQQGTGCEAWV